MLPLCFLLETQYITHFAAMTSFYLLTAFNVQDTAIILIVNGFVSNILHNIASNVWAKVD